MASDEHPTLIEGSMRYMQGNDGDDESQCGQYLEVRMVDVAAGDGGYYILHTHRWAFDSLDELLTVLQDALQRLTPPPTD